MYERDSLPILRGNEESVSYQPGGALDRGASRILRGGLFSIFRTFHDRHTPNQTGVHQGFSGRGYFQCIGPFTISIYAK